MARRIFNPLLVQMILLFITKEISVIYGDEKTWSYSGETNPNHWKTINGSHCGSWRQSPIDIECTKYWPALKAPKLQENTSAIGKYEITNNGHTVILKVPSKSWNIVYPQDPACIEVYGIHWHWGKNNHYGSEHSNHGKSFPVEGHMVCWNCNDFPNIETAMKNAEGLFVFGFFYELISNKFHFNKQLEDVVSQFSRLSKNGTKTIAISHVDISKLLPFDLNKYYRYEGSLTTPPCTENVIWTIFHTPAFMTYSQIEYFHKYLFFHDGNPMANNYRPSQKLNTNNPHTVKRVVYSSFLSEKSMGNIHFKLQFYLTVANFFIVLLFLVI